MKLFFILQVNVWHSNLGPHNEIRELMSWFYLWKSKISNLFQSEKWTIIKWPEALRLQEKGDYLSNLTGEPYILCILPFENW